MCTEISQLANVINDINRELEADKQLPPKMVMSGAGKVKGQRIVIMDPGYMGNTWEIHGKLNQLIDLL